MDEIRRKGGPGGIHLTGSKMGKKLEIAHFGRLLGTKEKVTGL